MTQIYKDLFSSAPYSGRPSSIKPSCSKTELNRFTKTEISWNKKRRCSNISGRLNQSLAQLTQELKSIPVNW